MWCLVFFLCNEKDTCLVVDEQLKSTSVFFHPSRVSSLTAFSCWNVAWGSIPESSPPGEHLWQPCFVDWCTGPMEKNEGGSACGSWMLTLLLIFTGNCYRKNVAKASSILNLYQRSLPHKWCKRIFLLLVGFSLSVKREREREDLETKPKQIETKRKDQKQKFRAGAENSAWSPEKTTDGRKKKVAGKDWKTTGKKPLNISEKIGVHRFGVHCSGLYLGDGVDLRLDPTLFCSYNATSTRWLDFGGCMNWGRPASQSASKADGSVFEIT